MIALLLFSPGMVLMLTGSVRLFGPARVAFVFCVLCSALFVFLLISFPVSFFFDTGP